MLLATTKNKTFGLLVIASTLIFGLYYISGSLRSRITMLDEADFTEYYAINDSDSALNMILVNRTCCGKNFSYSEIVQLARKGFRFVSTRRKGIERLGNTLFQYAAMLGVSRSYGLIPVLNYDEMIFGLIEPSSVEAILMNATEFNQVPWAIVSEKWSCADSSEYMKPQLMDPKNSFLLMLGYFQSYKYFQRIQYSLVRQTVFHQDLRLAASQYLMALNISHDTTLISVHIRRTDMLNDPAIVRKGYQTAGQSYLLKAVKYFLERFRNSQLHFLVFSDDMHWSRQNFPQHLAKTDFIEHPSDKDTTGRDLAFQVMCNHSLLTVGSYGYWGAYLKKIHTPDTVTVYYKSPFRPRSHLAAEWNYKIVDYYPPNWIPLGD